jgi:DNA-binding NtrC family response regulator
MKILVVEDDSSVREMLRQSLSGHELAELDSLALLDGSRLGEGFDGQLDLVLLDLKSSHDPDASQTLEKLPELKKRCPGAEIWVQSGSEDVALMRACIRAGAHRFVLKEHLFEELPLVLATLEDRGERRSWIESLIVGESDSIVKLREELLALGDSNVDVLVEGESGSGKELCAQALSCGDFIGVNIAAVPVELFEAELFGFEKGAFSGAHAAKEGLFEAVGRGVLFLDEIQALKPELQVKLLRVLETRKFRRLGSSREKEFRGRVVCASNVSLAEQVSRSEFREDLYYRIAQVNLHVAPLRLRQKDLPLLVTLFLREFDPQQRKRWTEEALDFLKAYEWPGNVRELRGLIRSLCARVPYPIFGVEEIQSHLSDWEGVLNTRLLVGDKDAAHGDSTFSVDWSLGLDANLRLLERHILQETLGQVSVAQARERLGMKRSRFYEKLRQYGLLTNPLMEKEDR